MSESYISEVRSSETVTGCPGLAVFEENRVIYINGEVTADMAFTFNMALLKLEHKSSRADITVYINSPGGSVTDGLSMIDTMNLVSCDVATICVGTAASMGSLLLMSGTKGKRKILPHGNVLIHQPLINGIQGRTQASDIEIIARDMVRTKNELYEIIHETTGQPLDKIENDCDRDNRLNAQEALEYGIVDEIIKSHKA